MSYFFLLVLKDTKTKRGMKVKGFFVGVGEENGGEGPADNLRA